MENINNFRKMFPDIPLAAGLEPLVKGLMRDSEFLCKFRKGNPLGLQLPLFIDIAAKYG